jgi:hypothetical protein
MPNHYIYHTKFLRYAPPGKLDLEDEGRRIYLAATFQVHEVRSDRDLVVIGRHDQTGAAGYRIEVNDRPVPDLLIANAGDEAWNETSVRVPSDMLVDGTNRFRMTRVTGGPSDVEWYYFWFAQPVDAQTARTCDAAASPQS